MFHVKDDFRAGAPVTQVGAAWFNKVGSFLNNLVGGRGVRIVKNESGPSYVELEDADSGGAGTVKSVDGVQPDAAGNVALGAARTVDGHAPDADGAVSFGLAGGKWLKTDEAGHIAAADEEPVTVGSQYTPVSGTLDVVVDVKWTGTQLQKVVQEWTFENGVLVSTGSDTTGVVDTPVMVTWS